MSYQVLARKYRPKGFDTLVGQEHVVRALSHALDSGRLHHAYLFTGTRGVGKTTLSRILAKAFNCLGQDGNGGVTSTPCGACDACLAIDAGRFVDYIEIDAASNRGVEEMAQLLEQAVYAPSNARFKVYMIDEVHMLSNHAFNSMLKTLEEPPPHVKFILATTDPQKIPVTVLSRCLQFNLKQMPPAQIVAHLSDVLGQEAIAFEAPALRLLAQGAQGSMRDALSLTDQAIAYAAGTVTLEAVQGMLGALDQSFLVRILDALALRDGAALIAVADDMATRSLSYNAALQDVGSLLHRIALAQTVPAAIAGDLPERADILRLADLFEPDEIQLFYQIAVHGRNELGLAPDDFAGFSMTLLRMLAFRPGMGAADSGGAPASVHMPAASGREPMPKNAASQSAPAVAKDPAGRASAALAAATPIAKTAVMPQPAGPGPGPGPGPVPVAVTAARGGGAISPARAALNAARSGVKAPAPVALPAARVSPSIPVQGEPSQTSPAPGDIAPAPPWDDEPMPAVQRSSTPRPVAAPTLPVLPAAAAPALLQPEPIPPPSAHVPVPSLGWDGNWPELAKALPVRGVIQQLAQQSQLLKCEQQGEVTCLHLQVAIETLRAPGSVDKLGAALSTYFSRIIRIETRLGAVQHSAHLMLQAERAERQRQAEQSMRDDPFVQTLMREFGATIVPGSIRPVPLN